MQFVLHFRKKQEFVIKTLTNWGTSKNSTNLIFHSEMRLGRPDLRDLLRIPIILGITIINVLYIYI